MELILTVALGAALAGFVQGLSGFGFGLTAMSIWAWTLEPKLAASLSLFGALVGQTIAAFTVRRGWDWKTLLPFVLGGIAGLPLGLYLLPRLDVPLFKATLGVMLVVVCPLMFFAQKLPRVRGGAAGDAVAGAAGGMMGGLGGFTGVVPTLWCQVRGFDRDRQRAVIQNFNLSMQVVTFGSYLATGILEPRMLPLLAVVAPAVLVPVLLGARVYLGISDVTFRKVVLGLLFASGIALLASSVPVLLAR
ncbi:sulfite exporter TauE/SafE family protein [Ramlibacter sp. USB13]|uniref:Probable membrane transporter protein n=1 Tax=Ramlibacter cellulosilyticus TaxID=2764187 RepID=A0A923MSB7_9BURK|nr:sulfite exporter TauE/SafE family protein [Ramlibacter cellulosilyticus]MBC5784922.1 sulfite exporter TauE/SafE family protein [Ramlibacter cellulosilyticus]